MLGEYIHPRYRRAYLLTPTPLSSTSETSNKEDNSSKPEDKSVTAVDLSVTSPALVLPPLLLDLMERSPLPLLEPPLPPVVELEGTTLLPEVLSMDLLEEVDLLELLRVDLEPLESLGATNKSKFFTE